MHIDTEITLTELLATQETSQRLKDLRDANPEEFAQTVARARYGDGAKRLRAINGLGDGMWREIRHWIDLGYMTGNLQRAADKDPAIDENLFVRIMPSWCDLTNIDKLEETRAIFATVDPAIARRMEILWRAHGIGCPIETLVDIAEDLSLSSSRVGAIVQRARRRIMRRRKEFGVLLRHHEEAILRACASIDLRKKRSWSVLPNIVLLAMTAIGTTPHLWVSDAIERRQGR